MSKAKPSTTTNRLHFEDLDPRRFEDLCHALVFSLRDWASMTHPGRTGNDDGIDIHAVEQSDDGEPRQWVIQCKRYKSIAPKQAQDALEAGIISTASPVNVFLLVVGCDVRKETHDKLQAHAIKSGVGQAIIWDASYLESTLYNQRKDLLFTYFGVNIREARQNREALVKRRVQLKTKMRKDFYEKDGRRAERDHRFRFNCSNLIIRSVEDDTYPIVGCQSGISPWFKTEPFDFYHNGLEVCLTIQYAIFDEENNWDILERQDPREGKYSQVKVWVIGRIPFDHIVTYEMTINEYGDGPFLYCRFANGKGEPYEEIVYYTVAGRQQYEAEYSTQLAGDCRRKLKLPNK
jgi:hypothetical protein